MKQRLKPQEYIVFYGGLRIENTSRENILEIDLPPEYTIISEEASLTPLIEK